MNNKTIYESKTNNGTKNSIKLAMRELEIKGEKWPDCCEQQNHVSKTCFLVFAAKIQEKIVESVIYTDIFPK